MQAGAAELQLQQEVPQQPHDLHAPAEGDLQRQTADGLLQDYFMTAPHRLVVQPATQKLQAAEAATAAAQAAARVKFQAAAAACGMDLSQADLEVLAGGGAQPGVETVFTDEELEQLLEQREAAQQDRTSAATLKGKLLDKAVAMFEAGNLGPLQQVRAAQEAAIADEAARGVLYSADAELRLASDCAVQVANAFADLRNAHLQRRQCEGLLKRADAAYQAAFGHGTFPGGQAAADGGAQETLAAAGAGAEGSSSSGTAHQQDSSRGAVGAGPQHGDQAVAGQGVGGGGSGAVVSQQSFDKLEAQFEIAHAQHADVCDDCHRLYQWLLQACREVGLPMPVVLGGGVEQEG